MRQLRLEKPPIRGTDVKDWQKFLLDERLLTDLPDGIFGNITAGATGAYQSRVGIKADGIVGPFTLARALEGGLKSTAAPLVAGADTNQDCTQFAAGMAAAGINFVGRYYSNSASPKTLKATEAVALSRAGIKIVAICQDGNDKLERFTTERGTKQAKKALELAARIGQPNGSAIYFATDFDPAPNDVRGAIMTYFQAVHDVLATSPYSVGVYGSGLTCRLIRDSGFAQFTWLSQSTGFREYRAFLPQADVVQAAPSRKLLPKLNIDDDIAQSAEFGAFQVTT